MRSDVTGQVMGRGFEQVFWQVGYGVGVVVTVAVGVLAVVLVLAERRSAGRRLAAGERAVAGLYGVSHVEDIPVARWWPQYRSGQPGQDVPAWAGWCESCQRYPASIAVEVADVPAFCVCSGCAPVHPGAGGYVVLDIRDLAGLPGLPAHLTAETTGKELTDAHSRSGVTRDRHAALAGVLPVPRPTLHPADDGSGY